MFGKKQKNRWDRFLRERKYRLSIFGLTPHFDWKVIVISFGIILIVITIFGLSIYSSITSISEIEPDMTPIKHTYVNSEKIDGLISEFKEKENKFNTLMNTPGVAE